VTRITAVFTALTVAASAVAASAEARTSTGAAKSVSSYVVTATLNASNVIPAANGAAGARGSFSGKLTLDGKKSSFAWKLKFSGLSGRATSAHLHLGTVGKAGLVTLTVCAPCLSGVEGSYTGPYVAGPDFANAILHGRMYVDVHTKRNPKGEIRGQLKAAAAG
jgi:hypothetical protein